MKSMTGFGAGEVRCKDGKYILRVELSSVNSRKGLDVVVNLPRSFLSIERELRTQIEKKVRRGRILLAVTLEERRAVKKTDSLVDLELIERYRQDIHKAATQLKLRDSEPELSFFLALPGVVKFQSTDEDLDQLLVDLYAALEKALDQFLKAREREGKFMSRELQKQIRALDKDVKEIDKLRPQIIKRARLNMQHRLKESGLDLPLEDERLLKEIALFADRSDITEETTRLSGHLTELKNILNEQGTIGRRLDFMIQEIAREVNTIGSKANNAEVSRKVVYLKSELEKIREQVQNFE
ncbi:MAG: YicC/YloC family endoribonuclease [Verrucomicrobiota bacterium]